ncbi:hypothetical protein ACIQPP_41845 [Streptomyces violaceusniger]|uniref:hypothetical protein n=1 Tax=Streptomyces violaceusniger TaxID=68280 RepID=UPI0009C35D40|nr:hypothetical protein [Streptomyces hygroscopicus]AQW52302.1 hypothetical protein SHXM_05765 [Streptomyces hygroscopicus]
MNGRSLPPRVQIAALNRLQSGLTTVLVLVAVVALAFTATNVTMFAIQHEVSPWIAWLLDPMVAVALGAVLIVDGRLSEYGVNPSGWASGLRWFAGLGTWVMNCWGSLWPEGSAFGVPRQVDPAGLVLHSIPPVLLIVLAEAITHYRRAILGKIAELRAEVEAVDAPVESAPVPPVSTPVTPPPAPAPAPAPVPGVVEPSPLVICGERRVYELTVPPVSTSAEDDAAKTEKLPADEALNVIRTCWVMGKTITEAARKSTRSTSYVHKVYQRLRDGASDPETASHDRVQREAVAA